MGAQLHRATMNRLYILSFRVASPALQMDIKQLRLVSHPGQTWYHLAHPATGQPFFPDDLATHSLGQYQQCNAMHDSI